MHQWRSQRGRGLGEFKPLPLKIEVYFYGLIIDKKRAIDIKFGHAKFCRKFSGRNTPPHRPHINEILNPLHYKFLATPLSCMVTLELIPYWLNSSLQHAMADYSIIMLIILCVKKCWRISHLEKFLTMITSCNRMLWMLKLKTLPMWKQESRDVAGKLRDASAVLFGLKFVFTTSLEFLQIWFVRIFIRVL